MTRPVSAVADRGRNLFVADETSRKIIHVEAGTGTQSVFADLNGLDLGFEPPLEIIDVTPIDLAPVTGNEVVVGGDGPLGSHMLRFDRSTAARIDNHLTVDLLVDLETTSAREVLMTDGSDDEVVRFEPGRLGAVEQYAIPNFLTRGLATSDLGTFVSGPHFSDPNDPIFRLDLETGESSGIPAGPLQEDGFTVELAFAPEGDLVAYVEVEPFVGRIIRVDPTTGSNTFVTDLSFRPSDLATVPVPEPATPVLLLLGLGAMAARPGRRGSSRRGANRW